MVKSTYTIACIHRLGRTQKKQIASILCTKQSKIELCIIVVQMQAGGNDCGLFAIAFATAIVNGISPGKYVLNQVKMRQHLYESLLRRWKTTNVPKTEGTEGCYSGQSQR